MRLLLTICILSSISWSNPCQEVALVPFEKKVNKLIKATFGKEPLVITSSSFPNITTSVPNRHFYTLTRGDDSLGYMVINLAHGCLIGGCSAAQYEPTAKYENFWYAVIFNIDFQIQQVKVLDYQSEYGYEICSKNWLKQFEGYKGCELEYGSREVDAISGATVSARSIVTDINNLCWLLR